MPGFFTSFTTTLLLLAIRSKSEHTQVLSREIVERQAAPNPFALLPGWTSVGCFTDTAEGRTLLGPSFSSSNMTPAACMEFCTPGGFGFAGVEFATQCFCDFVIQDSTTQVAPSQCSDPCSGDRALTCGSANFISIFASNLSNIFHPSNKPFVGPWQYKGCFTEQVRGQRNLERMVDLSVPVSVETCTAACKASSFALAGLENGGECWCGNSKRAGTKTPDADCGSACSGDPTEFCGSSVQNGGPTETTRMTLYQDTAAQFNLETCLTSNIHFYFNLNIFSQSTPSSPIPLVLVNDTTVPTGFFILSACADCNTAIGGPYNLGEADLGTLSASAFSSLVQESFSVNVGDSPAFQNTILFEQVPKFTGFCGMANLRASSDPIFPPLLLGANSRGDLWALCPNITAGGRLDVVFSPMANHPNYVESDCEAIFIEMDLISD